jgi:hypothetical protein
VLSPDPRRRYFGRAFQHDRDSLFDFERAASEAAI